MLWRLWEKHGKAADWRAYVEQLRATNRRLRRLVEILDTLSQARWTQSEAISTRPCESVSRSDAGRAIL
jgi:hypothetical protein